MSTLPIYWIWLGIIACVVQSALFAGLNLAIFSLSQLRLQIEVDGGNADAARVFELRKNSNQVLSTVIWGNVSTNVLLTLLSDSALAGIAAFLFSAVVITLLGEIIPQAYFSRNALRMTTLFLPFLNFYRILLFPLAKPTAMMLDWWLGVEGIAYMRERDVRSLIARSAASGGDIGRVEAIGARNFLDLDDVPVTDEGEPVDCAERHQPAAAEQQMPAAEIQPISGRSVSQASRCLGQEMGHRYRSSGRAGIRAGFPSFSA